MYLYFVSFGELEDYEVDFLAVHERKFSEEEMNGIIEELKINYELGEMPEKIQTILRSRGFRIVDAVGEFHLGYSAEDLWYNEKDETPNQVF